MDYKKRYIKNKKLYLTKKNNKFGGSRSCSICNNSINISDDTACYLGDGISNNRCVHLFHCECLDNLEPNNNNKMTCPVCQYEGDSIIPYSSRNEYGIIVSP